MLKTFVGQTRWGLILLVVLGVAALVGIAGTVLERQVVAPGSDAYRLLGAAMLSFYLLVMLTCAVCFPPLALRAVLAFQERIGNGERPVVATLVRHEATIVLCFWAGYGIGLLIVGRMFIRNMMSD